MDPELTRALAPALADLRATGGPLPRLQESDWADDDGRAGATLWGRDGSGRGVAVTRSRPLAEQVAEVADHVQEWAVEELCGLGPTNWPRCPHHPMTHPLEARVRDDAAWWTCPRDGTAVSEVGTLG